MWNIVTDSSCDDIRFEEKREDILYQSVPFYLYTDQKEYVDDGTVSIPEMMAELQKSKTARTSCPSPAAFAEAFRKPGDVIAFTISSELSGSFQSAETARLMVEEEEPGKRITVFNTRTDGPSIMLLIRETARMILDGLDYAEIISRIPALIDRTFIVYALSSFNNLIRNGRMSRLTGFLANTLGFWGVGIATPEGTIQIKGKVRGTKKVLDSIVQDLREKGRAVQEVVIVHCLNQPVAEALASAIREAFQSASVEVRPAGGLDCFYAEQNGMIIGYRVAAH